MWSLTIGEEFGGPKPVEKKKEVAVVEKKSDGPSKTELNKLKKKALIAEKRAEAKGDQVATESNVAKEVVLVSIYINLFNAYTYIYIYITHFKQLNTPIIHV